MSSSSSSYHASEDDQSERPTSMPEKAEQDSPSNGNIKFFMIPIALGLVAAVLYIMLRSTTPSSNKARVERILDKMSPDAYIGQMTQVSISTVINPDLTLNETRVREYAKLGVGSYMDNVFSKGYILGLYGYDAREWRKLVGRLQEISMEENGGNPILYGIDSVHGANYISKAVMFPQQINAGATFNPDLVYAMGRFAGRDTIAAGIPWIFSPILDVSRNVLWARTYETFGEDTHLVSTMAKAIIEGLQSNLNIAACMKHFIGYSKLPTGHDREDVSISTYELLNTFLPPFQAAVKANVKSVMENYVSINGVPTVTNKELLKTLLRQTLRFDGVLVTDYSEINNLHDWHRIAKSRQDAVRMALQNTSIDMSMVPNDVEFIEYTKEALKVDSSLGRRIRDSARRIVHLKVDLGLYDNPVPGDAEVDRVGDKESIAAALEVARESIVLLRNDQNLLPLAKSSAIFLTGHSADSVGNLCGGWSIQWQGVPGNDNFAHGISVRQGIESLLNGNSESSLTYFNGLNESGTVSDEDMRMAMTRAKEAAYTIVVLGEASYAEKLGDLKDARLPIGQIDYVRALQSTGASVIVVYVGGRPRLLQGLARQVPAFINAMLPGELGGLAIAEIIFGDVNPSGRLPITYPMDALNVAIPYNHRVNVMCSDGTDSVNCAPEWSFGAGLSYTTFAYSDLQLSATDIKSSDELAVSVAVRNTGRMAGKETVMLFLIQPFRELVVPEVKMLKAYSKVFLNPGQSTIVEFMLNKEDWSVYKPQIRQDLERVSESGDYYIAIGPETECDVYNENAGPKQALCATFLLRK